MSRLKDILIDNQTKFYDEVIDKVTEAEDISEVKTFASDLNKSLSLDFSEHHINETISYHWNEFWSKYKE